MAQSLSSAGEAPPLNSTLRAEMIREAVRWLAEREAEAKAINAEIREYKQKHIKGDLGFKIADFNAIYRVSQLEVEDRDLLLDCVREGFRALGIGQIVDWVDAAQATPRSRGNGEAAPDQAAREWGRSDGLGGVHDHAGDYPPGEAGHGDYILGLADGEAERDRVMALGDEEPPAARRRGRPPGARNRPKPQVEPWDEGAEF